MFVCQSLSLSVCLSVRVDFSLVLAILCYPNLSCIGVASIPCCFGFFRLASRLFIMIQAWRSKAAVNWAGEHLLAILVNMERTCNFCLLSFRSRSIRRKRSASTQPSPVRAPRPSSALVRRTGKPGRKAGVRHGHERTDQSFRRGQIHGRRRKYSEIIRTSLRASWINCYRGVVQWKEELQLLVPQARRRERCFHAVNLEKHQRVRHGVCQGSTDQRHVHCSAVPTGWKRQETS